MSRFSESYKQHPIHDAAKRLSHFLRRRKISDPDERAEFKRLQKLLRNFKANLRIIDGETVSFPLLTNMYNHINSQVLNQLQAYENSPQIGYLQQANNQIDSLFNSPLGWVFAPSSPNKQEAIDAIARLDEHFDSFTNKLDSRVLEINEKNEELIQRVEHIATRMGDLSDQIQARRESVDNQLSVWQEQFAEAQERRVNDYSEWISETDKETGKELKRLLEKYNKTLSMQEKELLNRIDILLSEAIEKHSAILDLYELTAGDSVAAGHIKNAERETKQANSWRNGTISFILGTVGWLIFVYLMNDGTFTWSKLLQAFSVTGVLLYGAGYCAQQSTKHRKIETQNRRFALEMKAVDPYLQSLNEEDRSNLKKELSSRFFAKTDETTESVRVIDEHALKSVTDLVEKVAKAVKS